MEIALRPKFWEAELYDLSQGVQRTNTSTASAGQRVGSVSRNDWWAYRNVNLKNIDSITARVSSGSNNNGRIEFRIDSPTGPKIGEVTVPNTGGYDVYRTLDPAAITDSGRARTRSTWSVRTTRRATCSTSTASASTAAASPRRCTPTSRPRRRPARLRSPRR